MNLVWDYKRVPYRPPPCFIEPDAIGNFKHDAPDNVNMWVFTSAGEPVCGRVVENAVGVWTHTLDAYWILEK